MDASARDFTDREEPGDRGAPPDVGAYATHPVVCSRCDGNRRLGPIEASCATGSIDSREALSEKGCTQPGGVEHDRLAILSSHLAGNAASDHVARGELGARVNVLHEAASIGIKQHRAIATDCLGDQESAGRRQGCRVELIELEVGQLRARAQSHGDAIAGSHRRIGGVHVELTRAATGQNDSAGLEIVTLAIGRQDLETGNLLMTKNQVASKGMFHHGDAGCANSASQCQLDGEPGGVASGVQNASAGMCCFESARELAIVLIEVNPEPHQIADTRWAFGAKHFDSARITQAGAGAQSISDVLRDAVVREHGCGNAALGEAGVAVLKPRLGDQGDGVLAAEFERSDEPGDAAANHDDVLHAEITALSTEDAGLRLSMRSNATRAGMATSSGTVMRLSTCPRVSPSSTHAM